VPEQRHQCLQRHAGVDQGGGVGVTQLVRGDVVEPGGLGGSVEFGADRVIVQLPGVKDIEEAKKLIGQTAKLEFMEQDPTGQWIPATGQLNGQTIALTGAYLVPGHQQVTFASRAGLPDVAFEFNSDGAQVFGQITQRLIQRPLGIFLDGQQISAPTVQAVLTQAPEVSTRLGKLGEAVDTISPGFLNFVMTGAYHVFPDSEHKDGHKNGRKARKEDELRARKQAG